MDGDEVESAVIGGVIFAMYPERECDQKSGYPEVSLKYLGWYNVRPGVNCDLPPIIPQWHLNNRQCDAPFLAPRISGGYD